MSHLADHARAARILSDAFEAKARRHSYDATAPILSAMAEVYGNAAARMESEVKAAVAKHGCTVDHRALTVPKCPACGGSRG